MTAKNIDKQLKPIVEKIVREYKPEKIILFGSYAWGKPHKDSDFDFFIVKRTKDLPLKRIEELDRLFFPRKYPMDFLVYTPQQVLRRKKIGDLFLQNILNHGKILYEEKHS